MYTREGDTVDEILNVFELAKRLRVSANWLDKEARAGRIPHLKAGRQYIFNPAAVARALAQRAAQETLTTQDPAPVG